MAKQSHLIQINFTGGIISTGYLRDVLEVAAAAQVKQVRFGLRQQLYIEVLYKYFDVFKAGCEEKNITFHIGNTSPNIISSYAAAGIFVADAWLTEGIYKDVFDLFDHTPTLKINICDSHQTFVPFFTGHLNWIASPYQHYWYLYIRKPGTDQVECWPELIYTNSIAPVCKLLEENLHAALTDHPDYISRARDKELDIPVFHLPYYEGFNRYNNNYWLGIYRRDEEFSVPFLLDVCAICLETGTGQLHATAWKSIIIKNIHAAHRKLWDYVLGKYNINVRHAANELNWQLPDHSEDALILKRHIIRHFDTADVRTYGLCFSIRMQAVNGHFGAIVIRRQENRHNSKLKYLQRYDILYTADFNPNSNTLILYRGDVPKEHLGPYITSLCKYYYEKGSELNVLQHYMNEQTADVKTVPPEKMVHQCPKCFTVAEMEEDCYICDTPWKDFLAVDAATLGIT